MIVLALLGLSLISWALFYTFYGLARLYKDWVTDVTNGGTYNFNSVDDADNILAFNPHTKI